MHDLNRTPERPQCSDEAARLLPWFVNDTLSEADAARVAAHLERCGVCRADAAEQQRLRTLLRAPAPVEYAPQPGLRKLLNRIDELERESPAALPMAAGETGRRLARAPVRWLAAAVVVQAVALATIVGARLVGISGFDGAARFHTLTSVAPTGARLRVVFTPETTLAELQEIMHAQQLTAIAGPSEAGIFTLALRPSVTSEDAKSVLARLRADPRVRFAEPVGAEPSDQ